MVRAKRAGTVWSAYPCHNRVDNGIPRAPVAGGRFGRLSNGNALNLVHVVETATKTGVTVNVAVNREPHKIRAADIAAAGYHRKQHTHAPTGSYIMRAIPHAIVAGRF